MVKHPNQWLTNHPKTTSHPMLETLFLLRRDSLWVMLTRRMLLHSKIIRKCLWWMVMQITIILAQVSMSSPKIRFSAKIKRKPSALTLIGKAIPHMSGPRTRGALAKHPTRITARQRIRAQRLLFQASSVLLRIARRFQNYLMGLSNWRTNLVKNAAKMMSTIPLMMNRSRTRSSMRPIEIAR